MPLKRSGVELIADGADRFYADIDKANTSVADFGRDAQKSAAGVSKFSEITTGALRQIGTLAVDALAEAGRAVVSFAADTVGVAGEYESSLNRFESVAGDSLAAAGMDVQDFSDLALEMGAETQFSAGQAADAMVELAKGGLAPATIAAGGLEGALSLAAAGELDLAQAAEISAKQLGVWGDQGVTAGQVADRFAQAANASTVNVDDLAVGMANVSGSAKIAGLTFDETTQALALLAPGFSSASDAGTSFKTFISRLIPSTAPATAAMIDLGLATSDGTSKFYDATGAFIGFDAAAALLHEQTLDLTEAQRLQAFQTIFGADAIRAAAIIAEKGAEGYAAMGESMENQGSAAEQAAKRNKGFGFALESLRGSLETIQIVVGGAVLPLLTDLIQDVLIPGANATLEFAQAVLAADEPMAMLLGRINTVLPGFRGTVTVVGKLADVLGDNLVPALSAAGSIMLAMGLRQLPILTAQIIAGTTAWTGYGLAMGLMAAGPFVIAAAAIFGLTKLIQNLQEKYATQARQVLESREWWTDSTQALDDYAASAASASKAVQPLSAQLEELRKTQEAEILSLGKRMAAGNISEAQYAEEMRAINARAEAIRGATDDLNLAVEATEAATYAQEHGTVPSYLTYLQQSIPQAASLAGAALSQLSDEDVAKLETKLESAAEAGTRALASWVTTTLSFRDEFANAATEHWATLGEIDKELGGQITADRRAELSTQRSDLLASYSLQQQDRAAAYATEAAAHRAHLGEMLIETVNTWALIGQVPADRAQEMNAALATEYGVAADNSQLMFGQMIGHLMNWRDNAGIATGDVIGDLQETGETALDTEQKMTNLSGDYIATLIQNFMDGKLDADELRKALERVPSEVRANIITNAAAVTAAVDAASSALDRLAARSNQTVNIRANISRAILAESPSPMETSLRNISEIIRTMPILNLRTSGLAQLSKVLSGGDATRPIGKGGRQSRESVEAHLRKVIEALRDTGAAADDAGKKLKTMLGQTIPEGARPFAGAAGADLGAAFTKGFKSEIDRGIPGAVKDALTKGQRSDKGKETGGQFGDLGKMVQQGVGTLGGDAGQGFADMLGETLELTTPTMITAMSDSLTSLSRESILPWAEHLNPYLEAASGFWMISLGEGISGNHAAIDAARGMGKTIAAALTEGYGHPVLPAPTIAGGGTVSPPASGQQITQHSLMQSSSSFAWSGNMVLPPGTPQQHGDALLDYISSRGLR